MTIDAIQLEIIAMEKRRALYSTIGILLMIAALASGYGLASSMNSGSFLNGLEKFFDYPGEIVREAWDAGKGFFGLVLQFIPALIETLNIAGAATLTGGAAAMVLAFLGSVNLGVKPPVTVSIVRRIMDGMRAIPELIIALFLIFILGSSPVPEPASFWIFIGLATSTLMLKWNQRRRLR